MKINRSFFENLTYLVITFFSFFVSILVFTDNNKPYYYSLLPLLPLSYGIINIFSYKIYKNIFDIFNNLALLVIHLLFFIRQSLAVYLLYIGDYVSTLYRLTPDNVCKGIMLMIYETVCVYILLNIYQVKNKKNNSANIIEKKTSKKNKNYFKIVGIMLFFLCTFCIFAYAVSPLIRNSYSNIFNKSLLEEDRYLSTKAQLQAGSFERILFTLFTTVFDFIRIVFPCWVLFVLRKYVGQKLICIIIGMFFCLAQFFMIINENMFIMISVFIIALFMMKLYPKFRNGILLTFAIFGITVFIFYFLWVSDTISVGTSLNSSIGDMIQIYCPGISNVACGFNVVDKSKLTTLFFDIYQSIPFHDTLFGLSGDRLSTLYNDFNGVKNTITPCITQAYHYLGVFAPIVTLWLVKIALGTQKKLKNSDNMFAYVAYVLLLIYSSMTPVCYYLTIFLTHFFSTILPMLILSKFAGKNYSFDSLETCDDVKI